MQPSAVLSVLVTTEGVGPSNAKLNSVQQTLKKTAATGDAVGNSFTRAGSKIEKAGSTITAFGKGAKKWIADPLLIAGGAAVAFGYKFEKSMLLIQTHTDTSRKNLQLYKNEILAMSRSGKYTQGPNELAEAMYHVASDGYQGAKAMSILRSSADLAMVGQSNLAETTYAVVSAVKNHIRGAKTDKEAIAALNAAMGAGDTKMQEITGSMTTGIIPAAEQMGLSFQDVTSSLDLLTQRGVPAQQGAYRLAMTFQMLIPHTEKAEKQFEALGLKNLALVETIEKEPKMGLLHAMELLEQRLTKVYGAKPSHQIQAIEEIFGGGRTSRGAISLLENLKQWEHTYEHINKLEKETPSKIHQAKVSNVNKMKEALAQLEAVLTEVGVQLLPAVTKGFETLMHPVIGAVHWFGALNPEVQHWLILMGAGAIALAYMARLFGPLITGIGKMIGWIGKAATANEEVVAGEEAKQAAYAETATAAQVSATEQVAAIQEVVDAQKVAQAEQLAGLKVGGLSGQQTMDDLMPVAGVSTKASTVAEDAGQLSMFGAPEAEAVAASVAPEMEAAGAAAAPAFAGAFAAALPVAIPAAIGIGAAAYFGPKIIDSLFGSSDTHHTNRLKKATEQASEVALESSQRQARASHTFTRAAHTTKQAQNAQEKVSKRLEAAQEGLNRATHKYGRNSEQATRAARKLKNIKEESIAVTRKLADTEKSEGVVRTALERADKTAIANLRTKKARMVEEINLIRERLGLIEKEPPSQERSHKEQGKLRELHEVSKALKSVKEEEQKLFQGAATQIGSKFSKYLEHINPQMYDLKKAAHAAGEGVRQYNNTLSETFQKGGHSLEYIITKQKNLKRETEKVANTIEGPFQNKTKEGFAVAAQSAQNAEKATVEAFHNIGTETNKMLTALGGKPLNFGVQSEKHAKTTKKARGGEISFGAASGDSVPALLEKGEYVMNREAVKAIGVHKLNEVNFGKAARFQEGGEVGGQVAMALAEANRINSEHFPYKWGGGHGGFEGPYDCSGAVSAVLHAAGLLPKPMVSGELASYGAAGPGPITIYANGVHAFMSIMGRFFGTSLSNPGGGAGWFPAALGRGEAAEGDSGGSFAVRHPTGVLAEALAKQTITGPNGALKSIGQGSVDAVYKAANKKISESMGGKFGGGDPAMEGNFGPGKIVGASTYHPDANTGTVGASGQSLLGKMAFAELDMGKALGDLPFGAQLKISRGGKSVIGEKLDIGLGGGPVDGHPRDIDLWYQTAEALGLPRDWLGLVSVSQLKGGQTGGLVEMLQKGGQAGKKGKPAPHIEKEIKSTLHGLKEGKHLPKFNSKLKKVGRQIERVDLASSQEHRLGNLTNEVEKWSEFASNASAMTRSVEVEGPEEEFESQTVQGIFKGGTEAHWLENELTALMGLRKQIITAHETIEKKTLPRIIKLLHHTQKRLRAAQKAIRDDEHKKRELEQKIRDLEKAQNDNIRKLEKEKNELENKLNKLQNAKHPDHDAIRNVRNEIKSKNEAINDTNKQANHAIKHDHERIHDINQDLNGQHRIEDGAKTLIGQLEERRTSLYSTMSSLFGQGGEFTGGPSFYGLEQVQGKGSTTGSLPNPPEFGSVGGEIFTVQARLKAIQEEAEQKQGKTKKPTPEADKGETELEALEKEIATEWRKRYEVSQAQFSVLSGFPSVGSIASIPYAGSFATGGSAFVAATVGERGREVAIMPQGSRIVPEHDAKEAIARMGGGGATTIKFEEFNYHEAEHRVSGRVNGQPFDEEVERVNRKQSRRSEPRTPGGKVRRIR